MMSCNYENWVTNSYLDNVFTTTARKMRQNGRKRPFFKAIRITPLASLMINDIVERRIVWGEHGSTN